MPFCLTPVETLATVNIFATYKCQPIILPVPYQSRNIRYQVKYITQNILDNYMLGEEGLVQSFFLPTFFTGTERWSDLKKVVKVIKILGTVCTVVSVFYITLLLINMNLTLLTLLLTHKHTRGKDGIVFCSKKLLLLSQKRSKVFGKRILHPK